MNNYNKQRPDNKNRQRFKNININKSNYINEEETNRRFDYTNLAEELLEKDDIKCSERVLEESCENFVDFNGETGLKEDLLLGIFASIKNCLLK